jgi:endonuclease/exonuclease/phosphatase family metal-dependent hydrolase
LLPALAVVALLVPAAPAPAKKAEVTVMTRNLYLGADLTPVIAAVTAGNPFGIFVATGTAYNNVVANNFTARAQAIAAEVAATEPDLIGLQEVSQFYFGTFLDPGTANSLQIDFLAKLQSALAAAGQPYAVVSNPNVESTAEIPAFLNPNPPQDIRLVTSNAILARTDRPDLVVSNPQGAAFATQSVVLGQPVQRNWQTVDVKAGKKSFRFLNTHLEAFAGNEAIRTAQARELADGPLRQKVKFIAVGDFNSNPGSATSGAYDVLTKQGKLKDAWVKENKKDPGLTCCRAELLSVAAAPLTERLDLVLADPEFHPMEAQIVGLSQVSGLYPSDHAGVVGSLKGP